jgi:hypothetical protein
MLTTLRYTERKSVTNLLSQFIVFRCQGFTMSTPWSIKFNQDVFLIIIHNSIKVLGHENLKSQTLTVLFCHSSVTIHSHLRIRKIQQQIANLGMMKIKQTAMLFRHDLYNKVQQHGTNLYWLIIVVRDRLRFHVRLQFLIKNVFHKLLKWLYSVQKVKMTIINFYLFFFFFFLFLIFQTPQ